MNDNQKILMGFVILAAILSGVFGFFSYEDTSYTMKECKRMHSYDTCRNILR